MRPETQYVQCGELYIAYQVLGEGPFDLVVASGALSNIEYGWEDRDWAAYMRGLGAFARVILFDKRGTGVSDRIIGAATLEERMEDVRAVMDAAGTERAALYGSADSAAMVALFAATYPDRAPALVLWHPLMRGSWAHDYPWALKELTTPWSGPRFGSSEHVGSSVATGTPSKVDDEAFARHVGSFLRLSATPTTYQDMYRATLAIDVRDVLPSIRSPTLVLHRPRMKESARYAADRITGARVVEIPGEDRGPYYTEPELTVATIREFLTDLWESGAWEELEPDRVLADRPLHRSRRIDRARRRPWGPRVGRPAARAPRARSPPARPLPRPGGRYGRRRVLRNLRRAGPSDPVRLGDRGRRQGARSRRSRGPPYGRVRGDRRQGRRHRRPPGIARRLTGQSRRGGRLQHGKGPRRGIGGIAFEPRGSAELKGVPGDWQLFTVRS